MIKKKKTKKGCCWVMIQQLYRDTEAGKAGLGARGWTTTWPAMPTIRPGKACNTAERKARHGLQRARGGIARQAHDTAQELQHGTQRHKLERSDTMRDTANQACDKARLGHDTAGDFRDTTGGRLRHDTYACHDMTLVRATTRPSTRRARGLGAVRSQWACSLGSRCALGAPNPVLDSVHCFSHYLRTLFMNTVHEHCSQIF